MSYFTISDFEHLFGPASSFYLFSAFDVKKSFSLLARSDSLKDGGDADNLLLDAPVDISSHHAEEGAYDPCTAIIESHIYSLFCICGCFSLLHHHTLYSLIYF